MTVVTFQDQQFALNAGESVLDALLRQGQQLPHACKAGVCQACLVRSKDAQSKDVLNKAATIPARAQAGLKSSLQASGYALACQWVPETDIEIALPGPGENTFAFSISLLRPLNDCVMKLVLQPLDAELQIECRPGQYLSLINPAGVIRSYSIANDFSQDQCLEFHVARTEQGLFSNWLFDAARTGDLVQARGPAGACFYTRQTPDQSEPLLLSGVGTGLAPLYGIVRDALEAGHSGPVTLLHAARSQAQLYYQAELAYLAANHGNFTYVPVVREQDDADTVCTVGDVEALTVAQLNPEWLNDTRVYLCGNPGFVQRLRKQIFLRGIRAANIFCDAFIERTPA